MRLIIISTTKDLFACRLEHECVLILGCERALNIDQWRVSIDNTSINQVAEGQDILLFANAIQVTSAEGQGPELLVDSLKQRLGPWETI